LLDAGPLDMQVGAHARAEGLIIVTGDRCELRRGCGFENWVDEGRSSG